MSGRSPLRLRPQGARAASGRSPNNRGGGPQWSRTGHELVYWSGNQLMTVGYTVNGTTFVADKPRVWIASFSGASPTDWDLAPDGKRVVAFVPEGTSQAPQQEHGIVMLQNFADELRRRVPLGK